MSVAAANLTSAVSSQLITTYSSGSPNWNYIPSAAKSNKTQVEFTAEITELATQAATAQSTVQKEAIDRQVLQLRTEYLSDVAPDRKSLYQSAQVAMKQQSGSDSKIRWLGELTLLDFLEYADGRGKLADGKYSLAGGGTLTCPTLSTGGNGVVIESQGVNVLSNLGHGWSYELTPAELTRKEQFYTIYWEAYRAAQGTDELSALPDYLEEKSSFDAKA